MKKIQVNIPEEIDLEHCDVIYGHSCQALRGQKSYRLSGRKNSRNI